MQRIQFKYNRENIKCFDKNPWKEELEKDNVDLTE